MPLYLAGKDSVKERLPGYSEIQGAGREVGKEVGNHSAPFWAEQDTLPLHLQSAHGEGALPDLESHLVSWGHAGRNSFQQQMDREPCGPGLGAVQALPPAATAPPQDRNPLLLPASLQGLLFTLPSPWSMPQKERSQPKVTQWERLGLRREGLGTFRLPQTTAGAVLGPGASVHHHGPRWMILAF